MTSPPVAMPPLLDDPPLWRVWLDPRGRIGRRDFWIYGVASLMAAGAVMHALLGIARIHEDSADQMVNLVLLWPALATSIKRWHDRDHHGVWVLVVLVPVVGWIAALVVNGFLPGTPGTNRFGPPPVSPWR